jgi:hypothetical protein
MVFKTATWGTGKVVFTQEVSTKLVLPPSPATSDQTHPPSRQAPPTVEVTQRATPFPMHPGYSLKVPVSTHRLYMEHIWMDCVEHGLLLSFLGGKH